MHRLILGDVPRGAHIDHINGNKLDNRRRNLRVTTPSKNVFNSKTYSNNTTGVRGVTLRKNGRYRATIKVNYKQMWLGKFDTIEAAKAAYEKAALEYFGELPRQT